jgi:hypothetical protein
MKNSTCSVKSGWVLLVAVFATSTTACVVNAESEETTVEPVAVVQEGLREGIQQTIDVPGQGPRVLKGSTSESSSDETNGTNGRAAPQANRSSGIAPPDHNVKAGGPDPWPWQIRDNK